MTDIIERVAKAICRANCPPSMAAEAIDLQTECAWDMWVPEARAAIETLRQPTNLMLRAADGEDEDVMVARGRAYSAWLSMIDAALSGPHINSIMGEGK